MKTVYVFIYLNQNEYGGTLEWPDDKPLDTTWMTEVPYPETERDYHSWCFNTETRAWDIEVEDYRNVTLYNKKDSTKRFKPFFVGPLPDDYILQAPPELDQQYYYDDVQESWVLYQAEAEAEELSFDMKKALVKQRLWEQCKNYMDARIPDSVLTVISNAAGYDSPKGLAVQRWVQEFWYPFYYDQATSIDRMTTEEQLNTYTVDLTVYGEPPHTIREINEELYTRQYAHQTLESMWREQTMQAIPLDDDDTVRKVAVFADTWEAGQHYKTGKILNHESHVYRVVQAVDSLEHQPPGAEGMLAIYRPVDLENDGTRDNPRVFTYGMDVTRGTYYQYDGQIYLAKADMPACTYYPGSEGMWQWELIEVPTSEKLTDVTL